MMNNIPDTIRAKIGKNHHNNPRHPVGITKALITNALADFKCFDQLAPVVSVRNNFDLLRIPADHPSRRVSDTYYENENTVLRTHTSAHQIELLAAGHRQFIVAGDVYRKDDIDQTHYPVFHQIEGVRLCANPEEDLKKTLDKVIGTLFPGAQWRWKEDYFPFTHPSWEVEVQYQDQWMEILGCGVIHPEVLANAGLPNEQGWAFGLGLDRITMKLFQIPDIRLLWSEDPRFLQQFQDGRVKTFQSYSKYPACYKDISFWIEGEFDPRNMMDIIRHLGGDTVERVELIDEFKHPRTGKASKAYRIYYRSWDRSLTNTEVDEIQNKVRKSISDTLAVSLR